MIKILALALALTASTATAQSGASGTLLVGNKGENSLSFVDLATGREVARRETGKMPHEIAISPDGRHAAVVSYGGKSIDIFDIGSKERVRTIDLGANEGPHGLLWLTDGRLVATTERSQSLTIVDTRNGDKVTAIPTGQEGSHMVAVSPDARRAFVANMGSGSVSVIDLQRGTKLRDIPAGKEPEGIALSPDGKQLWVADRSGDVVRVFDAASLKPLGEVATGETPIRVLVSPDGRTAITSNYGAGTLTLIDTATRQVRQTLPVSGNPEFDQVTILFAPDGRRLYVAETGIDRIAEVDLATGKVLGRLPAGKNGDGLGIAPPVTN